jgi:hypothetical protein
VAPVSEQDRAVMRDEVTRQLVAALPLVLLLVATSPKIRLWVKLEWARITRLGDNCDAAEQAAIRQLRRDLATISHTDFSEERWGPDAT